ncbi:MAG: phosphotransferase [Oscillospiraceae bacterium]|nr:phosphotransferase [Oscillospiraceae bacterium]MBQ9938102.1 phosphotransferase [Oscillospiraceae bacterium]
MRLDRVIAVRNDKTVYRDGDRCIKVFNAEYSKTDVLNEALNQARMEEAGLNVPKVIEVTTIDGKWAIVSEYIRGKTLAQLMKEEPEKSGEYIELLVELQMSIHRKSAPLLSRMKDKMSRKIAETELDATTRYDLHARLEAMPKHSKVCHGDFNPTNVIIAQDGAAYIIDWSHATQGNAAADAAHTYLLLQLKGYPAEAELYLDTYCQKSDTEKQYVRRWIPIVAAARSVGGNEMEREFFGKFIGADGHQ